MDTKCPVVVHISDLHLHPPFSDKGRVLLTRLGLKSHAYYVLLAAARAIRQIQYQYRDHPLTIVASGDLTTAGSAIAFRMAHNLLRDRVVTWDFEDFPVGLGASNWYVVPGNHDRYNYVPLLRQLEMFEAEFAEYLPMQNWPIYLPEKSAAQLAKLPRLPYVWVPPRTSNGQVRLVVVGLDSTRLSSLEALDILGRIARGRVGASSLKYLERLSAHPDNDLSVVDSAGISHELAGERVFTLVVLHHHPYLPPDIKEKPLTELLNATDVRATFARAGVDMVLYGHQHVNFVAPVSIPWQDGNTRNVLFAAAGSLCQFGEPRGNWFNVYRIESERVLHDSYQFDGIEFQHVNNGHSSWGTVHE